MSFWLRIAVFPSVAAAITRIIHQQYHSSDAATWPPEWQRLSSYWQAQAPWTWRFWTDDLEAQLFREQLPEFEELYQWIPRCLDAKISQADLSTYAILYVHGGVYADMDTMPLHALDPLLEAAVNATGEQLVLLPSISRPDEDLEVRGVGGLEEPYALDTDLMVATAPRHPFFLEALRSIKRYVMKHNQTVCGRDRRTPTYDLMFLTAWGRLSMLARSWTKGALNQSQLEFLEDLFLRDPVDATFAHVALQILAHQPLEHLQQPPPPSRSRRLERWLERHLQRPPGKTRTTALQLMGGEVPVIFQAPDLILAPIAVSPAFEKRQLRELHLKCGKDNACFLANVSAVARRQFPERDHRQNFMLVFNDDGGIWEGSWSEAEQAAFAENQRSSQRAEEL